MTDKLCRILALCLSLVLFIIGPSLVILCFFIGALVHHAVGRFGLANGWEPTGDSTYPVSAEVVGFLTALACVLLGGILTWVGVLFATEVMNDQ